MNETTERLAQEGGNPAFGMSFLLVAIGASAMLFSEAFKEADPHAVVAAATNYATPWWGAAGVKLLSLVGGISAVALLFVRLK